jgi:hypothetical protein
MIKAIPPYRYSPSKTLFAPSCANGMASRARKTVVTILFDRLRSSGSSGSDIVRYPHQHRLVLRTTQCSSDGVTYRAASVGRKSAAPSATNCRLQIGLCPTMMVWVIGSACACFGRFDSSQLTRLRWLAGDAHPSRRVQHAGNTAMKGRMRPLRQMLDQTVLHRIEMNVVQIRREVPVVADRVLPVSPLPDTAFAPASRMTGDRGSPTRTDFENPCLIARQRPGNRRPLPAIACPWLEPGSTGRQCMWSGSTTQASMWNGARARTCRTASRNTSICVTTNPTGGRAGSR